MKVIRKVTIADAKKKLGEVSKTKFVVNGKESLCVCRISDG